MKDLDDGIVEDDPRILGWLIKMAYSMHIFRKIGSGSFENFGATISEEEII